MVDTLMDTEQNDMPSFHDNVSNVRAELEEMKSLDMIDERVFAAATRYVATHGQEISEMCVYSSISEVADSVCDIARSTCNGGKCHV